MEIIPFPPVVSERSTYTIFVLGFTVIQEGEVAIGILVWLVSPYAKDELVIKTIPDIMQVIIIAKCKVFILTRTGRTFLKKLV